ncbi:Holliday junction resolvase RecU [[Mycoplasma] falconis]|uniref:Holliday junction resolvase RecU n=1 Tax=[Mycoplasma] falconis TaxID=92403 RepID=A0A501XAA4_9BACT|nr:Holliday junction resolvase RecU [[Mycoplasma] falconis]TPE57349.1 Holliday junction resolvase RecU [[Mycoplasma] falconis]
MKNTNNRGMFLESIINKTNEFYLLNKMALIHKKNLDIKFKGIDLVNKQFQLKDATIKSKSTVDYYGVFNGRFLAFEAKSTEEKNFTLYNIKKHQIEYLDQINFYGGLAFWIIYFSEQNTFYFIWHTDFKEAILNKKTLTYAKVEKIGILLKLDFPGILDYLWPIKNKV